MEIFLKPHKVIHNYVIFENKNIQNKPIISIMLFGHGANMLKDFKTNRKQLRQRKSLKETMGDSHLPTGKLQDHNHFSQQQLNDFKARLKAERFRETRRNIAIAIILGLIILSLVLYLVRFAPINNGFFL